MIERMFKWIVCARQPLSVDELREAIAFTLHDEERDHEKLATDFNRLVRACGNIVVVDEVSGSVELAHYTVQQYFLQSQPGSFHFTLEVASNCVGQVCVAYLNFRNFDSQVTRYRENSNTDMATLSRIAGRGAFVAADNPGRVIVKAWNVLQNSELTPFGVDMVFSAFENQQKSLDICVAMDRSDIWQLISSRNPEKHLPLLGMINPLYTVARERYLRRKPN